MTKDTRKRAKWTDDFVPKKLTGNQAISPKDAEGAGFRSAAQRKEDEAKVLHECQVLLKAVINQLKPIQDAFSKGADREEVALKKLTNLIDTGIKEGESKKFSLHLEDGERNVTDADEVSNMYNAQQAAMLKSAKAVTLARQKVATSLAGVGAELEALQKRLKKDSSNNSSNLAPLLKEVERAMKIPATMAAMGVKYYTIPNELKATGELKKLMDASADLYQSMDTHFSTISPNDWRGEHFEILGELLNFDSEGLKTFKQYADRSMMCTLGSTLRYISHELHSNTHFNIGLKFAACLPSDLATVKAQAGERKLYVMSLPKGAYEDFSEAVKNMQTYLFRTQAALEGRPGNYIRY
jgi:hypothetical protein